jgi:excisionase family DNA binding protein
MTRTLLTRSELAKYLQLSENTIYLLERSGRFPRPLKLGHRLVRYDPQVVEDWLKAQRPP